MAKTKKRRIDTLSLIGDDNVSSANERQARHANNQNIGLQNIQNDREEPTDRVDTRILAPIKVSLSVKSESLILMDFPRPTLISTIIAKVSKSFSYTFVMQPELDRRIQIFSPGPIESEEAFKVFTTSVGAVGLRLVFMSDKTIKIVEKLSSKNLV